MRMKKSLKSILPHQCRRVSDGFSVSRILNFSATALLLLSGAMALVGTAYGATKLSANHRIYRNVPYVANSASKYQMFDVYLPEHIADKPLPLVVFIHGGGWYEGDKANPPVLGLLARGFAVASVNYRLTDEAPWPAQIHDVKAAIRYLRANAGCYNLDPNRIGVWGMSAGAHLAALAGTSGDVQALEGTAEPPTVSSRVQAVVDWFGPADFSILTEREIKAHSWILKRLLGGLPTVKRDAALEASPVTYTTADDPPFLLMHGDKDNLVPLVQSKRLQEALRAAGVPAELVVVPRAGHQMFKQEYLDKVAEFFAQKLQNGASTSAGSATSNAMIIKAIEQ